MKYSELIQYDPIERIIQLRDANKAARAKNFVSTYVFSDLMAEKLKAVVFPQMRIDAPGDAKGLLIVGNYGTGKSHLMSVISAIAEHGELLELVDSKAVREAAGPVAGKFKVIRMEIGSTEMGLRKIVTQNIEKTLREWDIDFTFPAADQITENKSSFEALMTKFDEKFPGKGLLIVVDELLDYLRSRNQQALTLDLGFLREIGEVCKDLRFRFMAGVQEAIFDSDRFAFVSESLSRVKDRFDQVRIQKTDITYVVSHRLLKKSAEQKSRIREYLEPFAKFYDGWTEHMDEFVDLFPVHPDYVQTFERLPVVEQRGVLQVLSLSFKKMMEQELPKDYPGLLALDSFWSYLTDNPAHRTDEDIRATMECSDTLVAKVRSGFPSNKKQYRDIAIRIVEGLSVHRLTNSNINAPIGMTPEEIRDQLCLYHPFVATMGGDPAEDLLTVVNIVLKEIRTCVSGQFLSQNDDNRQWFLDLKKIEDFDAHIEKRVEILSNEELDSAYFSILSQLMEITDVPSEFTGFRIWESSMPWKSKNVTKLGWLFFGVPSERSTAQPPRDFYVYFPQYVNAPAFKDEKKADEVFFRLDDSDETFRKALSLYAAALALRQNATGAKKQEYIKKADQHFNLVCRKLRENFLSKIKGSYKGHTKSLSQLLAGENAAGKTTREQIFLAASNLLNGHFEEICGDYPKFTRQITFGKDGNAGQAVQEALRALHSQPTQTGAAVLDGLALYDGERIDPTHSPYAAFVLSAMRSKGQGQVLNRNELIREIDGIPYFVALGKFRLEPELLLVVLGALVYSGETVLVIPGKEFAATNLAELSARPIRDLLEFKHLKQPKDWNVSAIKALFELLELSPGMAVQVTQNDNAAVVQLVSALNKLVEKLVMSKQELLSGIPFWGAKLLEDKEINALSADIDGAKNFLESLQAYNSPGKLKNFPYTAEEIQKHKPALGRLKTAEELKTFADSIAEYTVYLSNAEAVLPEDHPWRIQSKAIKADLRNDVLKPENRSSADYRKNTIKRLQKLKQEYIQVYLKLYRHGRLDMPQDRRKQQLLSDPKMAQLKELATIQTMNVTQLCEIQSEFGKLKTGQNLTEDDLQDTAVAGEFYPAMESAEGLSAGQRLSNLESKIEQTHKAWTDALLTEFDDPVTKENLKLVAAKGRKLVEEFLKEKELPERLPKELIAAIQQTLSGLTRVAVKPDALMAALFPAGAATTVDDFKEHFAEHLDNLVKGHDKGKVRLVLDRADEGRDG